MRNLWAAVEESVDWRFPRLVCAVRGHRVVRHITEARLRDTGVVWMPTAWGVSFEARGWYFQCSRCCTNFGRTPPPRRRTIRDVISDAVSTARERFHRP